MSAALSIVTGNTTISRRPMPSDQLSGYALAGPYQRIEPAHDLAAWVASTFIDDRSYLFNKQHAHLKHARVGILWTNVENARQQRRILGQAEIPMARAGKWAKARHDLQLRRWFDDIPNFLITLDAPFCATADDVSFCALVEHELFHCAQAVTAYGVPKFSRTTGKPIFALRGHDVEEFVGIVERYGVVDPGIASLVAAGIRKPLIDLARIATVCGTMARAA